MVISKRSQLPFGLAKSDQNPPWVEKIGTHRGTGKIFLLPLYETWEKALSSKWEIIDSPRPIEELSPEHGML